LVNSTHSTEACLSVRPYQLMCLVCRIGSGLAEDLGDPRLTAILRAVRADPDTPMALRCNVGSVYRYQNPGTDDDTPEGELFNIKRDLDILHRLGLAPGDTRPARELFLRVLKVIETPAGICGYDDVTADAWRSCDAARSGHYEKGRAMGIAAIIPPRDAAEKARTKQESAAAIYRADRLLIRPHHLMCMTCFHGGRERLEPIEEDNLFEVIDVIQKNPDVPIELIRGCCMICPPCSHYDPERKVCVGAIAMGLRDEKKDLDVLQRLGLGYGDVMPARDLLRLLYQRILSTRLICAYGDGIVRSHEWTICRNPEGSQAYRKGRAAGLGVP
jgi:hypothetical protein